MVQHRRMTVFILAASLASLATGAVAGGLSIGDWAPDFELVGSDGETYRLADFGGERVVVLAWFPKAFTGG